MAAAPRWRSVSSATVLAFLLSALSVLWVLMTISPQTYRPLMLLVGVWASLRFKPAAGGWGGAVDLVWVVAALFGLGWPLAQGDAFWYRATTPTGGDLVAGVLAVLVVIEATRRTTGWALPIVTAAFLLYAVAGPSLVSLGLTGIAHRGYDLSRLIGSLYMSLEGIYGVPLDVAVTYITLFSLYGAVLEASGAGTFFLNWSLAMAGGARSSASTGRSVSLAGFLLGTVSGSGVATTVTLGSMAWPLLKRAGFAANTAGAMLAASGIGALLSPPTLGAAAFLIAEYLRISYLQVLVMATIPTVLYYASITLMIEGDARHLTSDIGHRSSEAGSQSANPQSINRQSSILNPQSSITDYLHFSSLILVAALMALGFTPFRAVFWAIGAAVGVSVVVRQPLGPRRLAGAFSAGGTDALSVLSTTAVAGIIVGIVTLTGLGLKAAGLIVAMAGGSLALTVLWSAIAVWILGLAVPVTASYIIAAVMVVPALTSVGVAPAAAHMFVFYYAVLSEVSPPTALAPFAAAALTGGRPFRTMMLTWKYALPAFLVPIAFTLDPRGVGLLLQGSAYDIVVSSLTALAGTAALAAALTGAWGFGGTVVRVVLAVGGVLLFHPALWADAAGVVLLILARVSKFRSSEVP
ncbi:MAG: TRAP transporter fused permease subunit [Acidimicrobiia bacterium]|nr:TRAP transporter fused permease subunit [Acidimicrobiia bacterium]